MLLLAVETSSDRGSIAVLDGERLEGEALFPEGLVHGREITVHLASLMARLGLSPSRLEAIAVGVGPGSYTGIRVGVTAAKTLAFALRIPVVAESSLRVLAANARGEGGAGPVDVVTAVDAKQRHVYVARFRVGPIVDGTKGETGAGPVVQEEIAEHVLDLSNPDGDSLSRLLEPVALLIGDGGGALLEAADREGVGGLCEGIRRGPGEWDRPLASVLGKLAARILASRAIGTHPVFHPEEVHRLTPVYLRASEAELKLAARSPGGVRDPGQEPGPGRDRERGRHGVSADRRPAAAPGPTAGGGTAPP